MKGRGSRVKLTENILGSFEVGEKGLRVLGGECIVDMV